MTRLIIHPGFHKTGTTSLQRVLELNVELLNPYVRVILKPAMEDVLQATKDYSNYAQSGDFRDWAGRQYYARVFSRRFRHLLKSNAQLDGKALLISSEELFGRLPGRDGIQDYRAAPMLARLMQSAVLSVFGNSVELTLFCTTRQPDDWMQSTYAHLLQYSRLSMDFATFSKKYACASDLDKVLQQTVSQCGAARVHVSELETSATLPLGTASELLELLELPTETLQALQPAKILNVRLNDEDQTKLREMNSSDIDDEELAHQKRRYVRKQRNRRDWSKGTE